MKKLLFILTLFFVTSFAAKAQAGDGDEKIRDKMSEFIQRRMQLNKTEAERFTPVFLRYFREWRMTLRDNKGDRLILQQKVVELRLRYRNEFRDIVGEKRCNEIYQHQEVFIQELKEVKRERMQERPARRFRAMRF